MREKELNEYILNYLENDKTKRAIMLTAPWGAGKSYYIQYRLKPFLETNLKEANKTIKKQSLINNKNKLNNSEVKKKIKNQASNIVITVSLYGLTNLKEVNKNLYIENSLIKKVNKNLPAFVKKWMNPIANSAKGIAKTLAKSLIGTEFNLSLESIDIQKVYDSVDLSYKLIVFEDIERSQIDIIDFFGYINNLCEQDGVKVLLVANEKELLKYETKADNITDKKDGNKIKVLTEKSKEYLRIKEKTVSDTIIFQCYSYEAMVNIMREFNNKYFNSFFTEKDEVGKIGVLDELEKNIIYEKHIDSPNLRSFIIACQKTIDMYNHLNRKEPDLEFLKYIFLANTAFILQKKQNDCLSWDEKKDGALSSRLGTQKYPLPKFCYNYICNQFLDEEELDAFEIQYCSERKTATEQKEINSYINIIYNYYRSTEKDIRDALNKLIQGLKLLKVPFSEYGKLAKYITEIRFVLDDRTFFDECKSIMLKNLNKATEDTVVSIRDISIYTEENDEQVEETKAFINEMFDIIKDKNKENFKFDYKPESVDNFYKYVCDNRDDFVNKRVFAKKFDNEKLTELLEILSPAQIDKMRNCFYTVYSFSNINYFFIEDKESLIELKEKIENLIENSKKIDKIQKLQLNNFIFDLDNFIARLI